MTYYAPTTYPQRWVGIWYRCGHLKEGVYTSRHPHLTVVLDHSVAPDVRERYARTGRWS